MVNSLKPIIYGVQSNSTYDNNVPKSILDKSHPKGVRKLS